MTPIHNKVEKKLLFKRISKCVIALIIIGSILGIKIAGLQQYISLDYLHTHLHAFDVYLHNNYMQALGIYVALYIAASTLAIPGSTFFLTAAGLLFGPFVGIFITVLGSTTGATLLFLLSRYVIGESIQQRYKSHLERANRQIEHYGAYYLLMVRLIAVFPFFVVNLLAGLTLLSLKTFIWTTAVGVVPTAMVYTFIGHYLRTTHSLDMLEVQQPSLFLDSIIFLKLL